MNGWISVDNALPQEPGRYLVCSDRQRASEPFVMRFHRGRGWFAPEMFDLEYEHPRGPGFFVTHWIPLPDAAVAAKPE